MYLKSPKQWEVLLSPIRGEIAQALRCIGPCSAAELAKMVDRPADTLYRHLEQLKRAGFVVEHGERKKGRHHERLFDVTADDFAMDFTEITRGEGKQSVHTTAKSFLGTIDKSMKSSLDAGALVMSGAERNFVINYELSWLTPEKFKKARQLMYEIKQLMDEARPKGEGRLYCTLTVMCPVTRSNRRATPGKKPARASRATEAKQSSN
jgi:DNA-binding transcriptional ArsR family regulator